METDGGGWTLAWSYTFKNYSHFTDVSNSVTPRPDWLVDQDAEVGNSTTPPLHETDYNAINFSLWKQLGSQVLVKSNINNWLVCHPKSGSLVLWQDGSVGCQIIIHVTDTWNETKAPTKLSRTGYFGPMFHGKKLLLFWRQHRTKLPYSWSLWKRWRESVEKCYRSTRRHLCALDNCSAKRKKMRAPRKTKIESTCSITVPFFPSIKTLFKLCLRHVLFDG